MSDEFFEQLDKKSAASGIEDIKSDESFDSFLACTIAERVACRDSRYSRSEVGKAAESIEPKVKEEVDVRLIVLIMSPDEHEGHNLPIRRRDSQRKWPIVTDDGLAFRVKSLLDKFYPYDLPFRKRFIRKRTKGCIQLIKHIVNENEDFFLSDD